MKDKFSLRQKIMIPVLVGAAGLIFLAGSVSNQLVAAAPTLAPEANQAAAVTISRNETLNAIEGTLEEIYNQVNPAVVSIQVTQKQTAQTMPGLPDFPAFRFFFGQPQGQPEGQQPQEFYSHGAGSGFVWDKQGHIVTNNHVVENADKITVTFANEEVAEAELVGTDPDSDLAVLKVDLPADQLQPVTMADSTGVKVGQLAVAIGNPFGLENTMTVGFVSALGRLLPVTSRAEQGLPVAQGPSYTIPDIIQTDAPINPGNSGGVLVNDQGQVIGVTAAIESPVRASVGIGFAIPAATVKQVVPALIKDGSFEHPWLGLSGVSLNPELTEAMDLTSNQHGALVIDVTPGSPAEQAGLQGSDRQVTIEDQMVRVGGDVITAIDGEPVKSFDDLVTYLLRSTKVDQAVTLTILRDGQEKRVSVTLAARPKAQSPVQPTQKVNTGGPHLGIQGVTVTPEIAAAMELPEDQTGVLVERIEVGSPADQADLNGSYKSAPLSSGQLVPVGGDIITAVDGKTVKSMEDLQASLAQAKMDQKVTLTVLRDGRTLDVLVTLSQ
ncbi:MAG: trypsin-like peptidase domain-containing protein [Anaerolineae bacterium]|nr:trypsin-like peptidase domain-containing protein [Anaerolineae bacterium]